jgi:hypothetical protein
MAIEQKEHYKHLQNHYKGYQIEEFKEDYMSFRAIIRIINSYFKNPCSTKTHAIYNKIILLHRVFDRRFINLELINNCDDEIKKSYLKYILNEFFNTTKKYRIDYFEEQWERDVDKLKNCDIMCKV